MGGKGGDSGGSQQQDMNSMQRQATIQAQQDVASAQAKAAASQPAAEETKKTEETKPAEDPIQSIDKTSAGGDNLSGLGDELVSGLAEGRIQQVKDQTERTSANPQTYGTQYDPYSGVFVGQGPYPTAPPPTAAAKPTGTQV